MAIVTAITAAGSSVSDATPVVRFGPLTIVTVTSGGSGTGVVLPSNAQIGDSVEICADFANTVGVIGYPPSGSTIDNAQSVFGGVSSGEVYVVQKLTATSWRSVSTYP